MIVGVSDSGEIAGISLTKESTVQWLNEIKTKTSPIIIPDVEIVSYNEKNIVVFSIQEYPIKPVSFRGKYYKRVSSSNHLLATAEVVYMHLQTFNTSWDYHIDHQHNIKDISLEKVSRFIRLINKNRLSEINDEPLDVLKKFELIRNDKITVACFLLFNKQGTLLSTVELGAFHDNTTIIDGLTLRDDLFTQVERILDFIDRHIQKAFIITGKPQREEKMEYPPEAIREIVLNMLVHRDYSQSGDSVIKIYNNRIEFYNPGSLIPPITIEKLLIGDYVSNARNKQLASMFKEAGLIEKYGSGVQRIAKAFKVYNLLMPKFEIFQQGFRVTVYKNVYKNVTENVTENRLILIEKLIKENPTITTTQLSKILKVTRMTVSREIEKLKTGNKIKRIGPDKGGSWEVLK